jgi:hypothetical protein
MTTMHPQVIGQPAIRKVGYLPPISGNLADSTAAFWNAVHQLGLALRENRDRHLPYDLTRLNSRLQRLSWLVQGMSSLAPITDYPSLVSSVLDRFAGIEGFDVLLEAAAAFGTGEATQHTVALRTAFAAVLLGNSRAASDDPAFRAELDSAIIVAESVLHHALYTTEPDAADFGGAEPANTLAI